MVNTLKKTSKKGFTLVELVIVIAILVVLAAIAIPTVSNVIGTANANVDAANAQTVELALKTADAEISAGTITGITTESTVIDVLSKYGISLDLVKSGKSGASFTYLNNRVYCQKTGVPEGTSVFKPETKLNEVITHS